MTEKLAKIKDDMKQAMKAGEKEKLATIRLILAAVKQYEVDNRKDLDDAGLVTLLTKQAKQRRESIEQFSKANRDDLIKIEQFELEIINNYLPQQLSETEVDEAIKAVMSQFESPTVKDMGKIMAEIKPKLSGRADMALVSRKIKEYLN